MNTFTVSKTFKFDAAHRLIDGYVGKCSNLHGHSWKATVSIVGHRLNDVGMLYDFNDFRPLREWIDNRLDHVTILNVADNLVDLLDEQKQRLYIITDNPTSENIAREIYHQATTVLGLRDNDLGIKIVCVEVWESETSKAVYCGS